MNRHTLGTIGYAMAFAWVGFAVIAGTRIAEATRTCYAAARDGHMVVGLVPMNACILNDALTGEDLP